MILLIKNIFEDIKYSYIILFVFLLIILGIYAIGLPQISINFLFLALFVTLFCLKKYELILFLYIALLPTNGFVNTEYNILGIVNSKYIISLFSLFSGILLDKQLKNNYKFDELSKFGFEIIVFVSIYLFLQNYKVDLLGVQEISISKYTTRFIKVLIDAIVLFYIIKLSNLSYYKLYFQKAFGVSLLLIALSMIFASNLYNLGVYMGDESRFQVGEENQRLLGIWGFAGGGDVNTIGGFLVMGLSCILFSFKKTPWLMVFILILGIMVTGSRTAFVNLSIVFVAFMLFGSGSLNKKIKRICWIVIFIFVLFTFGVFDFVIERIMLLVTGEDGGLDAEGTGRLAGWIWYLNYILSDLNTLLWGTSENIYDVMVNIGFRKNRVVHNFYIQLWYFFGIFALLIFLFLIIRLCFFILKKGNKVQFFLVLPALITLFTVSDVGVIFYIPIVLTLFTSFNFNLNQKKYVYKK